MEQDDLLHLPDFASPDFTQPALEAINPGLASFVVPDPDRSPYEAWSLPSDMIEHPAAGRPDPALPDLLALARPDSLNYPAEDESVMAQPKYAPEVVMQQRPGELDPPARTLILDGSGATVLPGESSYAPFSPASDGMTRRKRHFTLLAAGLERAVRADDVR